MPGASAVTGMAVNADVADAQASVPLNAMVAETVSSPARKICGPCQFLTGGLGTGTCVSVTSLTSRTEFTPHPHIFEGVRRFTPSEEHIRSLRRLPYFPDNLISISNDRLPSRKTSTSKTQLCSGTGSRPGEALHHPEGLPN